MKRQLNQTYAASPARVRFVRFATLCLAGALCACLAAGCSSDASSENPDAGKAAGTTTRTAPDAPLTLLDGTKTTIAGFEGKTVVLNFWATWCPYCIEEMPDLEQLQADYPDIEVVLVNCGESKETVNDFVEKKGYDVTWALDPGYDAQTSYEVSGLPSTAIIDAEGNLVDFFEGAPRDPYATYEAAVKKALA